MTKRSMLLVLMSCVALAAAPIVGCGGTDDPTLNQNGDAGDGDSEPGDLEPGDGDLEPGNGDDEPGNGDDEPGNGDDEPGNGDDEPGDDEPDEACEIDADFFGQVGTEREWAGGTRTTTPYTESAGIQAIYDYVDGLETLPDDFEQIVLDPPLQISGATIIGTGYGEFNSTRRIWLQDSETGIFFYRRPGNVSDAEDGVPIQPYVGQKVSFQVDSIDMTGGNVRIRNYSNWTVDAEDAPVYYQDITTEELNVDDHYFQLIRIAGRIGERDNPGCGGGQSCYDFTYGESGEHTITFRISEDYNVFDGECLTFMGPAGAFPGVYGFGDLAWQLDTPNFAWARVEFSSPFD